MPQTPPYDPALHTAGCAVLDEFLLAFNARDATRWAATLNYPHVRLAGGEVLVWKTREEFIAKSDFRRFEKIGWNRTAWDYRNLVQGSPEKMHFLVKFTRYRPDDAPLASYESLYILTNQQGRWGIQARSSWAQVIMQAADA